MPSILARSRNFRQNLDDFPVPPTVKPPDPFELTTQLVVRAQAGSAEAREDLFARYLPRVRRIVGLRLGRAPGALTDLEDVVHDALHDAFKSFRDFELRSEGRFRHWLARIVENRVSMALRHQKAQKRDPARQRPLDTDASRGPGSPAAPISSPSRIAGRREAETILEQRLLTMKERHREIIIRRLYCEMSYAEIAEDLGLASAASARDLYSKALRRLGEVFTHDPES